MTDCGCCVAGIRQPPLCAPCEAFWALHDAYMAASEKHQGLHSKTWEQVGKRADDYLAAHNPPVEVPKVHKKKSKKRSRRRAL